MVKSSPILTALLAVFLAAGAADASVLKLANQSRWDIHHLFLSPSDADQWGPDQLGKNILASGGSFDLTSVPCDTYDLMLVDEDGDECVLPEVNLCGKDGWVITDEELLECQGWSAAGAAAGAPSTFLIVNDTDWQIHELYVSSADDEGWGPDQLGDEIIDSGDSFELHDIPCGTYDLMLVDEDGDECVVPEIDLCGEDAAWHLTNDVLLGCQAADAAGPRA